MLTLNTEKTEYMLIGSRQRLNDIQNGSSIRLGNDEIKRPNETKTLGIIVDDQLLWKNHINASVSKISKGIGILRRMKPYVPKFALKHVHNALILPHFDYCSLVWDTCSNDLIEKLQKMQNRAARVITGKSYETRSIEILTELGWQPLVNLTRIKI